MSHPQQMAYVNYVKSKFANSFKNSNVLEVGSLNINGSVRMFFDNCQYTGIDVGPGRGVDVVCPGQDYDAPDSSFDTIISCECFEHNPYWVETFQNMIRMCKTGGLIIMTCATTGREEHGTTRSKPQDSPLTINNMKWDYYKNLTQEDFLEAFDMSALFSKYAFDINDDSHDLYFWGVKR